jgi:hypothetical protein
MTLFCSYCLESVPMGWPEIDACAECDALSAASEAISEAATHTRLCDTCLVEAAFGWSELTCMHCAVLADSADDALHTECVQLMAFGFEDATCSDCSEVAGEPTTIALAN